LFSVVRIRHQDDAAEGQCPVRCCQLVIIEDLTAGRPLPLPFPAIGRRFSGRLPFNGYLLGRCEGGDAKKRRENNKQFWFA